MVLIEGEALLPGPEEEAFAGFEEEVPQAVDGGRPVLVGLDGGFFMGVGGCAAGSCVLAFDESFGGGRVLLGGY